IKVEFYRDTTDAIGWKGQIESADFGNLEEWERVAVQMQMPDDANLAQVYIRLYGPGAALYDDVSFHVIEHVPGINIFTDRVFYYEQLTEGLLSAKIWPEGGLYDDKSVEVEIYEKDSGITLIQ